MKPLSNDQFAKEVMKFARPERPFNPQVHYDPDGDCVEFFAEPDDFYAERIDDVVTVYYSRKTNALVGSMVKGVSKFYKTVLNKCPGLVIEIHDGRIQLSQVFRAYLWTQLPHSKDEIRRRVYKKIIECADQIQAEAELLPT